MRLVFVVLAACGSPRPSPPVSNTPPLAKHARVTSTGADVIAAALERFRAAPDTLPDNGLVGTHHYVMIEPGTSKPQLPAPFVAMTKTELEAEADRTGANVGFIHIFAVEATGDNADITIGGDVAIPAVNRKHRLCCCEGTDHYTRTNGVWSYASTGMQICS
jgi:hypothetical protein